MSSRTLAHAADANDADSIAAPLDAAEACFGRSDPFFNNAIFFSAGAPSDEANVLFMTVMATGMPFVGRG